jgi:hypothetical protein
MRARTQASFGTVASAAARQVDDVAAPVWANELIAGATPRIAGGCEVRDAGEFALVSSRVVDAAGMDAAALENRVAELYGSLAHAVNGMAAHHPVRLWNHIPAIHESMDARRDRYMVFNAGRYKAFAQWLGGPEALDRQVATASGVGHNGRDLVVHCLSARTAGVAVDNPRQIAPHKYSQRWGPLPPCFARGTVLRDRGLILVGGTASVRGEDSLHVGSLPMQVRETLINLATVIESACGGSGQRDERDLLAQYRELRVYYPRPADAGEIEAIVRDALAPECRIEMRRADLCRAELLVEIEGVAGGVS